MMQTISQGKQTRFFTNQMMILGTCMHEHTETEPLENSRNQENYFKLINSCYIRL